MILNLVLWIAALNTAFFSTEVNSLGMESTDIEIEKTDFMEDLLHCIRENQEHIRKMLKLELGPVYDGLEGLFDNDDLLEDFILEAAQQEMVEVNGIRELCKDIGSLRAKQMNTILKEKQFLKKDLDLSFSQDPNGNFTNLKIGKSFTGKLVLNDISENSYSANPIFLELGTSKDLECPSSGNSNGEIFCQNKNFPLHTIFIYGEIGDGDENITTLQTHLDILIKHFEAVRENMAEFGN